MKSICCENYSICHQTFALSISTQVTLFPVSEKQVPVTNPTYPMPTTANFT